MPRLSAIFRDPAHSSRVLLAALFTALLAFSTGTAPKPVRAGDSGAVGAAIVGLALICATNPKACGGSDGGSSGGGNRGPADAVALDREQRMLVQEGLRNAGFYHGTIDGALGPGSRGAIREYQAAIGAPVTGVMSGPQVNDLVALAPQYAVLPADDPHLFTADLAPDLDRDGVRELQSLLNNLGLDAGPVDGAWGGKTRRAVERYKAMNGLPGKALPTRRLLAHLRGLPPDRPAGYQFASQRYDGAGGAVSAPSNPFAPQPAQPAAQPAMPSGSAALGGGNGATQPATAPRLDVIGVETGMKAADVSARLDLRLGNTLIRDMAAGSDFGGSATLSLAELAMQPDWPTPGSEEVVTFYNAAHPEAGLLAAFRLIAMPDGVDQAAFEAQVLPDIAAHYGAERRIGTAPLWVGSDTARADILAGNLDAEACGALALGLPEGANIWSTGAGPVLVPGSEDSVRADCGDVIRVSYEGNVVRIGLWATSRLAGGDTGDGVAIPKIKF